MVCNRQAMKPGNKNGGRPSPVLDFMLVMVSCFFNPWLRSPAHRRHLTPQKR
jgi:hypothetical protein